MFTWLVRVSDLFWSRFILHQREVCVSVFLPFMKHRDLRELCLWQPRFFLSLRVSCRDFELSRGKIFDNRHDRLLIS